MTLPPWTLRTRSDRTALAASSTRQGGQYPRRASRQSLSNVITLYDTGGSPPDTDEQDILLQSVQARVRAKEYPEGYAAIRSIVTGLTLRGRSLRRWGEISLNQMHGGPMNIGRAEASDAFSPYGEL